MRKTNLTFAKHKTNGRKIKISSVKLLAEYINKHMFRIHTDITESDVTGKFIEITFVALLHEINIKLIHFP